MRFEITALPVGRIADEVDLSSATTAKRTGPAAFAADGRLDIPFDRALTPAEVDGVTRLLTSPTDTTAALRKQVTDYLALTSPSTVQNTAMFKGLSRLVLEILDRQK